MTLLELATDAVARIGRSDESTLRQARHFLRRRYEQLWDAHPWRDTLCIVEVAFGAAPGPLDRSTRPYLLMPPGVARVMALRLLSGDPVPPENATGLWSECGALFQPGQTTRFLPAPGAVGEAVLGDSDVSTSDAYTDAGLGYCVTVEDSTGAVRAASLRFPVSAEVIAHAEWIIAYSKAVTSLPHSLEVAGHTIVTLAPGATVAPRRARVLLLERPPDGTRFLALGRRECRVPVFTHGAMAAIATLPGDESEPEISGLEPALVAYATADLYEWERQHAKAARKSDEAAALVAARISAEALHEPHSERIRRI